MTIIERARLKPGQKILYKNKPFTYKRYTHKAHILYNEDHGGSIKKMYEYLSNDEILETEIVK